jgi:predicted nucleic acid-binding protein
MIGLDTNILARFLLADDVGQHDAARRLIDDAACSYWVPVTVVLELSWVLKGRGVPGPAAARAIADLALLPNMRMQSAEAIAVAARAAEDGFEFADALHLAMSGKVEQFLTFDRQLVRRCRAGSHAFPPTRVPG